MENQKQIVDELCQLCEQYFNEVPSKRRTWPKSIKERILQLLQLELSCEDIAKLVPIPAPTIYSWKSDEQKKKAKFLPVQVVQEKAVVPAPARQPAPIPNPGQKASRKYRKRGGTPTIIVIAPNGLRFEGLDAVSAIRIARELGAGTPQ